MLEGNLAPSHAPFFPISSDQNFEIAILFSIVEKPKKYIFEGNKFPLEPLWKGLKVLKFPNCIRIVFVIVNYACIFLGGGGHVIFLWLGQKNFFGAGRVPI